MRPLSVTVLTGCQIPGLGCLRFGAASRGADGTLARMVVAVVKRTIASRWRLGQTVTPVAMILGVVARRTESTVAYSAAAGALILAAIAFLSARRTFRRVQLRAAGKHITAALAGEPISISGVSAWTILDGTARVYDPMGGWMFRDKDTTSLASLLTSAFGPPLTLRRRGTDRARYAALCVACAGTLAAAAGFGAGSVPLVIAGLPLFIFGLAFFGALSQRVVDDRGSGSTSPTEGFPHRASE